MKLFTRGGKYCSTSAKSRCFCSTLGEPITLWKAFASYHMPGTLWKLPQRLLGMLRRKSLSKGIGFPIVLQKHLHSNQCLATLTFVDGLVNPTSHARYTLEIAPEVTRCVVGFTSPSTKVRVANHWGTYMQFGNYKLDAAKSFWRPKNNSRWERAA